MYILIQHVGAPNQQYIFFISSAQSPEQFRIQTENQCLFSVQSLCLHFTDARHYYMEIVAGDTRKITRQPMAS
jgi:hypothetical protein